MKTLTDKQMIQAWSHMSTDKIRAMGFLSGPGAEVERVNAGRRRILAMREALATQEAEGAGGGIIIASGHTGDGVTMGGQDSLSKAEAARRAEGA